MIKFVLNTLSYPEAFGMMFSSSFTGVILTLLGALVIICIIIFYFTIKLRSVNRDLKDKNKQILDINSDLQRTNSELAQQKNLIEKEHVESEKFYRMLLQSADDGISFYDRDWNLKYANSAFYSVIGLDRDSYHSIDPGSLLHPEDIDYPEKRVNELLEKGFMDGELRVLHKNGQYINLASRSVTVKNDDGEILGSLIISRDITRLKQVHEELIKANVEVEASNRLKSNFLANISHEIRTPLNSVVGFSNLLLEKDLTDEVKEQYVEQISFNSEKLLQIIGDIIDLSRLESSQIEIVYEETSVDEIIREISYEARQNIRRNEKSLELEVRNNFKENSDLIFTDRNWLKRVLTHLMDNAVKFTLEGSIELSYYREKEKIVFKILDTGIGINKENLSHIFKEFRQEIDGHKRPFEGLGVGLTLVKAVIERMGGEINVESEKGVGSEFCVTIPYRPAGKIKPKFKTRDNGNHLMEIKWSSKKCLIVDDNRDVLIYLNRILADTGLEILLARSGFEAVEIIRTVPDIDVVLLDMQMPEMNGIETAREIRKIRKDMPIIAQTAFIFEDDKDIILEAGCDACLIKPIRKDQLLTVMSDFIKSN